MFAIIEQNWFAIAIITLALGYIVSTLWKFPR